MYVRYQVTYCNLNNFRWAGQKVKVCFISHKVMFRWEECFINWSTVLYESSKLIVMHVIYHHIVDTKGVNIPIVNYVM